MNSPSKNSGFLQRSSYRRRRIRDAARLMPFLGAVLWLLPLSWAVGDGADRVGSSGLLYIFGVWVLLIVLTAALASGMRSDKAGDSDR